jgi:hypothetical protein
VPFPILVRPPLPKMKAEDAVLVLSRPTVSVAVPRLTRPAPASEPMLWLKLLRSRVVLVPSVKALIGASTFAAQACSVPASTLVAPK